MRIFSFAFFLLFFFFYLVSPSRKLWLFAVSLRAVEYTETVDGGFQTHRFCVPCIILDTLDTLDTRPDWVCICWLVPAISLLSPQDMHK
jgi:hypothetical protein